MADLRSIYVFRTESDYDEARDHLYREMYSDYNNSDCLYCRGYWGSCSQFNWEQCWRIDIYSDCSDAPRAADIMREHGGKYYKQNEGCFITSAVCGTFGKPDDCDELTVFRKFRDTFMSENEEMKEEVTRYYDIAPRICETIEKRGTEYSKNTYAWIWDTFLSKAYYALNNHEFEKAHEIYRDMVLKLEKIYL